MDSTKTRATLGVALVGLIVLVVSLASVLNRSASPFAQDNVEVEVLSGVLVDNGSPGDARPGSSAQALARPAQPGGPGGTPRGGPPSTIPPVPPAPPGNPGDPRSFGIAGSVQGLYPGFDGTLILTLANPHRFDIVVTDVAVQVALPTGTGDGGTCVADDIGVVNFEGPQLVAQQGTAQIQLAMTMRHSAPDACQGASWELSYTGTASRANQQ